MVNFTFCVFYLYMFYFSRLTIKKLDLFTEERDNQHAYAVGAIMLI